MCTAPVPFFDQSPMSQALHRMLNPAIKAARGDGATSALMVTEAGDLVDSFIGKADFT